MNKKPIIILVVVVVIIGGAAFYYFRNQKPVSELSPIVDDTKVIPAGVNREFDVIIKENSTDKSKCDIYFRNNKTGQENFFITLSEVPTGHYHATEYHNGNLYVIRGRTSPEELWRYTYQKQGERLYSSHTTKGFDFRVSQDEKLIAVKSDNLFFLRNDGSIVKIFTPNELGVQDYFSLMLWSENFLWLNDGFGPTIESIVKIETNNFTVTKFDVSDLPIQVEEFDINPTKSKIVFSDRPTTFDEYDYKAFKESKQTVSLFLYDLVNKNKQIIATSVAESFKPTWIDTDTIEYNAPEGNGRLTKTIP